MTHPGVILAGGRGLRLGGADKALLRLAGLPLAQRVAQRLAPQSAPLAINANGDPARLATLGLPVLPDPLPDFPGPLAGVMAAMDWAAGLGADQVVTVPADTPFLPLDLVARLVEAARGGVAVASSPDATGRLRRHPTCALWPVGLRRRLAVDLGAGARKLGIWADQQGAGVAAFDATPLDPFFNINTPEDLARAEALL
jgi:molybdopterin-guanine dinucleotide biosynthesis protein A